MKLDYVMNISRDETKMILDQIIYPSRYPDGCKHASVEVHKVGHITAAGNWSLRTDHVIVIICNEEGFAIAKDEFSGGGSYRQAQKYIREALKS